MFQWVFFISFYTGHIQEVKTDNGKVPNIFYATSLVTFLKVKCT